MDVTTDAPNTWRVGRYRDNVYTNVARPRWVAVYGLQWQVFEALLLGCRR